MEITQFTFAQFVLAVTAIHYSLAYNSECECSKIPLEERLLEKMVRIEFSLEQMEKQLYKTQDSVSRLEEEQNRRSEGFPDTILAKIENVSAKMENFSVTMENKTAELAILEERVRVPLVAFSAYNPDDKSPSVNQVLVFKVNPLNEGTGYNPKTGVFTAPVKGLYQFSAHMCTHPDNYIVYAIVRDDEIVALSTQWDSSGGCSSVNALATINAGQGVKVKCILTSGSVQIFENQHRRNSFSGVLLHKQ
ncbi:EMILIN-2-like [Mercenaria mercenaria]|uniref:EMILIN-2-like n=1 Tax=Mercenaria mercenaria TaxID=6596 RepID=UPI00234EA478|nr:EMILIN-2-like [Mercenaria mercenaria]